MGKTHFSRKIICEPVFFRCKKKKSEEPHAKIYFVSNAYAVDVRCVNKKHNLGQEPTYERHPDDSQLDQGVASASNAYAVDVRCVNKKFIWAKNHHMRGTATIPSSTKVLRLEEGAWICRRCLSLRAAVNLQLARPTFVLQGNFRHRLATVRQPKIGLLAS